jgi:iron(III) transport system substrate-binding protein
MRKWARFLGVVFLLTFVGGAAYAQLMVYGAIHEYEIARLLDAFTRETGIKADFFRASAGVLVARITAEAAAPKADIFLGGPAESHEVLAARGLLEQYRSPVAAEIDARFHSPDGYWHGFYLGALGIAVHVPRFEKEIKPLGVDYPKTWECLLHPAYKGEFLVANARTSGTAYTFVVTQLLRLGEEAGWEFLEALHKNVHHYPVAGAAPALKAAAGESIIGVSFGHDILKPIAAGFPLRLIYPPQTGWEIGAISIIKGGPNLENAKRFVDWMLGREAGQLHTDLSLRISTRTDVVMPPAAIPLEEIDLIAYDLWWAAEHRARIVAEWSRRFEK